MAQTHYDSVLLREVTEFFTAPTNLELYKKMDDRRDELQAQGKAVLRRTKIGRNTTCLCGSGLKFKKCCLSKAR